MAAWTLDITINGVSVTVTGTVAVKAEESTAKLARFAVIPTQGAAFDPEDYIGKPVVVVYDSTTIFTGRVETAVPDTANGVIEISATDGLQEYFENLTEAQILSAIPGSQWHRAVHGDRQSGWEQAQEALQSVLSEVHLTRTGNLAIGDWTSVGGTTYTSSDVTYVSERVQLAQRHTLINKVQIVTEYRFTRLWWAMIGYDWYWPALDFCDWKDTEFTLPSRDMIQAAAEGTGWPVLNGIQYQTLPPPGTYPPCGAWAPSDNQLKIDVLSASWSGYQHWSQPVRERYTMTVSAPDSIARYGEILQEDGASYESAYDAAAWDAQGARRQPTTGFTVYQAAHLYSDQDERNEIDAINALMLALASRRIWSAHRQNLPEFSIGCVPTMDLSQAATVDTPWLTATGKIFAYEHRLDTATGLDITLVVLACARGGSVSAGGTLNPPPPPSTGPSFTPAAGDTSIPTRLGNADTALVYDPDWEGYTGNYLVAQGSPAQNQIYEDRFRIVGPDVPAAARDEIIYPQVSNHDIQVMDMQLSITTDPIIP